MESTAIDLSHHLNTLSLSRHPSPIKDILSYLDHEGMISLAGGLPHPSLFPFASLEVEAYIPEANLSNNVSADLVQLSVPKVGGADQITLANALQYAGAQGLTSLCATVYEFTKRIYRPQYKDFEVLINLGNTDGWMKVVSLLCEPGDYIIVEEFTYPSAQTLWIPMGCKAAPVKMDAFGMRADSLEKVLGYWNVSHPGVKRPHVLYTVPTGQNPVGCVMSSERRKQIYDVCVKYDIIIVEDDPYYFLQFNPYVFGQNANTSTSETPYDEHTFLNSLERTFLSYDTQGRVIRMDSFSKTLAPGNRVGWFTANQNFCERLVRASEVMVQTPSGWSQAILARLLEVWTIGGYLRWLSRLRLEYETRRTWMCDAIKKCFDVTDGDDGQSVVAHLQGTDIKLFSFVPPRGGMFMWLQVYLENNAAFQGLKGASTDPRTEYEQKLWAEFAAAKILLMAGSHFKPFEGKNVKALDQDEVIFFRLSFSMPTKEDMEEGVRRMASVFERTWN